MAQETFETTDTLPTVRTKLNSNAAEVSANLLLADAAWSGPVSSGAKSSLPSFTTAGLTGGDTVDIGAMNAMQDQVYYLTLAVSALLTTLSEKKYPSF